jgi:hypothetical protein
MFKNIIWGYGLIIFYAYNYVYSLTINFKDKFYVSG